MKPVNINILKYKQSNHALPYLTDIPIISTYVESLKLINIIQMSDARISSLSFIFILRLRRFVTWFRGLDEITHLKSLDVL